MRQLNNFQLTCLSLSLSVYDLVGKKGPGQHDEAASKIQKGKKTQVDRLREYEEEHIDISETPSEAEELFLDTRKDEALAAVCISKSEQASVDE